MLERIASDASRACWGSIEVRPWASLKALPRDFWRFLLPVALFGISNFAPTFLILCAQDLLTPALGALAAATFAVGLYTFSNIVYALVAYPIGSLVDRLSKGLILSIGFALFGLLCLGFLFADGRQWVLVLLFALAGIYTAIVESSQPALASTLMGEDLHGTGFRAGLTGAKLDKRHRTDGRPAPVEPGGEVRAPQGIERRIGHEQGAQDERPAVG